MYTYGTDEYHSGYLALVSRRRESESRPFVFLTPEWCSAWEEKIQQDERYKQVAKNWEGSVVLVFRADQQAGLLGDRFIFLDLWHGECKFLQPVPESTGGLGEAHENPLDEGPQAVVQPPHGNQPAQDRDAAHDPPPTKDASHPLGEGHIARAA